MRAQGGGRTRDSPVEAAPGAAMARCGRALLQGGGGGGGRAVHREFLKGGNLRLTSTGLCTGGSNPPPLGPGFHSGKQ